MRTAALLAAALLACATAGERAPVKPEALDERSLELRCGRAFASDCRLLGRERLRGEALPQDDRLAASYVIQGCEMGDPAACSDLGVLHALGRGVPQSDERAGALSRRACEEGAAVACSNQGALLAEGAGRKVGDAGADGLVLRLFRKACEAGVPEGCSNLGTALESGRFTARDVRVAARAHRKACDAGFALACHRLALLLPERPDAAPDLTATALETRACRAAIAPACGAISEATPGRSARTPATRLVEDRGGFVLGVPGTGGFSPGELAAVAPSGPARGIADARRPPQTVKDGAPAELRDRLGLDVPTREPDPADRAIELLVAHRRHQLGQCNEAPRAAREPAEAFVTFLLDRDGRPADIRAASRPSDAALEDCIIGVVATWEFPSDPGGYSGPFLARHAFGEQFAGPRPEYASPGSLRPELRDPSCVGRSLRVPPEYRGSTGSVTVKLAVDADGKPGLVHALTPVPDAILSAVAEAVTGCAWAAGGDTDGRPAPRWVTLPVKLEGRQER